MINIAEFNANSRSTELDVPPDIEISNFDIPLYLEILKSYSHYSIFSPLFLPRLFPCENWKDSQREVIFLISFKILFKLKTRIWIYDEKEEKERIKIKEAEGKKVALVNSLIRIVIHMYIIFSKDNEKSSILSLWLVEYSTWRVVILRDIQIFTEGIPKTTERRPKIN